MEQQLFKEDQNSTARTSWQATTTCILKEGQSPLVSLFQKTVADHQLYLSPIPPAQEKLDKTGDLPSPEIDSCVLVVGEETPNTSALGLVLKQPQIVH